MPCVRIGAEKNIVCRAIQNSVNQFSHCIIDEAKVVYFPAHMCWPASFRTRQRRFGRELTKIAGNTHPIDTVSACSRCEEPNCLLGLNLREHATRFGTADFRKQSVKEQPVLRQTFILEVGEQIVPLPVLAIPTVIPS